MYCTNCGSQMPDGTRHCTNCGAPLYEQATTWTPQNDATPPRQVQTDEFAPSPKGGSGKLILKVAVVAIVVGVLVGVGVAFGPSLIKRITGGDSSSSSSTSSTASSADEDEDDADDSSDTALDSGSTLSDEELYAALTGYWENAEELCDQVGAESWTNFYSNWSEDTDTRTTAAAAADALQTTIEAAEKELAALNLSTSSAYYETWVNIQFLYEILDNCNGIICRAWNIDLEYGDNEVADHEGEIKGSVNDSVFHYSDGSIISESMDNKGIYLVLFTELYEFAQPEAPEES